MGDAHESDAAAGLAAGGEEAPGGGGGGEVELELDLDLDLGELDITSDELDFALLRDQLAKVSGHKVIRDVLSSQQGSGQAAVRTPGGSKSAGVKSAKDLAKDVDVTLRQVEIESIEGYVNESGNLEDLHSQIVECDEVLDAMEDMLGRFQGDLSEISSEIKHIQQQSLSLNVKLKNRRELHEKLSKFADNMQIPPTLIDTVLDCDVNSAEYLASLQILHRKLNFLRTSKDAQNSLAFQDVAPELSKLEAKAVSKVKAFLLEQFAILRKPKTNIQIQQQNRLLRLKGFISFIKQHNQVAYKEIRTNYTETVGAVLLSHFRVYLSHVSSLEAKMASRVDVIGAYEGGPSAPSSSSSSAVASGLSGVSNFFSQMKLSALNQAGADRTRGPGSSQNGKCFELGERGAILTKLDESAVVPHVAESQGVRMSCEEIFRSINKLLLDSSSSEFIFSTEFFRENNIFQETMGEVMDLITEHLSGWVQDIHDPIGLLLMIRINYFHRLVMQRRRLPCLDAYMDNVNMTLWPKLKLALDNQLQSLNNCQVSLIKHSPGRTSGGAGARFSVDAKLAKHVEGITKRFSDLLLSLVILNQDFNQGQLQHSMERLTATMEDLLLSLAKGIKQAAHQGGSKSGVSASASFLVNNYGSVVHTLSNGVDSFSSFNAQVREAANHSQRESQGGQGTSLDDYSKKLLEHFEDLYTSNVSLYVEEELLVHLSDMIAFVKKVEQELTLSSGETSEISAEEKDRARGILGHFRGSWQAAIQQLNKQVHGDYSSVSEATAKEVLKATLTQLLLYYTRFVEVIKQIAPELVKDSVTIPSIMYEIKKFR